MAVNSQSVLAIVTLIFYIVAAPLAIYVGIRHRARYGSPWFLLLLLALFRIVGEPMVIAANAQNLPPTNGVSIAANILTAIGLSALLLMCGALLEQVNTAFGKQNSKIHPTILRLMQLVPLAALILSSIGSSNAYSSKQSERDQAQTLRVAAIALYFVYLGLLAIASWTLYQARRLMQERRSHIFVLTAVASLPFLAVRTVYAGLITFGSQESQLANTNSIWLRAFMGSLMEWIVVGLFIAAGLMATPEPKAVPAAGAYERGASSSGEYRANPQGRHGQQSGINRV